MLPFRRRTSVLEPLPLACDPAMKRENSREQLAKLAIGETEGLKIPDDATMVTLRALSDEMHSRAGEKAGRLSFRGQRLAGEMIDALVALQVEQAARPDGDETQEERDALHTKEIEALDDQLVDDLSKSDYQAWRDHRRWIGKQDFWTVAWGLRRVSDLPDVCVDDMDRYPFDVLEALRDNLPAAIAEMARHIRRVSLLGHAGKAPCAGRSGAPTSTPTPSDAKDAPESDESDSATAGDRSSSVAPAQ